MFKLNKVQTHNKPIESLLNNGYRFALISVTGAIVKTERYKYKLGVYQKALPGSKIVEIKDLLING